MGKSTEILNTVTKELITHNCVTIQKFCCPEFKRFIQMLRSHDIDEFGVFSDIVGDSVKVSFHNDYYTQFWHTEHKVHSFLFKSCFNCGAKIIYRTIEDK